MHMYDWLVLSECQSGFKCDCRTAHVTCMLYLKLESQTWASAASREPFPYHIRNISAINWPAQDHLATTTTSRAGFCLPVLPPALRKSKLNNKFAF